MSATTAKKAGRSAPTVAEYVTTQLEFCNKSQAQVATEVGFEKPNVITMIKQGKTKLPLNKVGPMARALGVDAVFLFGLVMNEYFPDTWESIQGMTMKDKPLLTENELEILFALREAGLTTRRIEPSQRGPLIRAIKGALPPDAK